MTKRAKLPKTWADVPQDARKRVIEELAGWYHIMACGSLSYSFGSTTGETMTAARLAIRALKDAARKPKAPKGRGR